MASDYLVEVNVASQLPNALDRAIRTALTRRAPTALVIPSDLQEEPYSPPGHEFKQVPSSDPSYSHPVLLPQEAEVKHAAEILNAGSKVAILIGQGARSAAAELLEVAELTGAGVAKALLGKDVLPDDLPYVTGSIGLLGTRPSYELMRDCDTLLIVGSNFPYSQFLPDYGQARAVQIDIDGSLIGMRYPTEVEYRRRRVRDAEVADTAARAQSGPVVARDDREERRPVVGDHRAAIDVVGQTGESDAHRLGIVRTVARQRHCDRRLGLVDKLVRPLRAIPRRCPRFAVRHAGHHGAWRCHTQSARSSPIPTGR